MSGVLLALITLAFLPCTYLAGDELLPYDPVANPLAQVVSGAARFTVLTPRLIRAEYSPNGQFENRATLAVVNRKLPVPQFTQKSDGRWLTITTSHLTLRYAVNSAFNATSLRISSPLFPNGDWYYGAIDNRNLFGTVRSLDEIDTVPLNCTIIKLLNMTIHDESMHCEWGLISRNGWAVIDDSNNFCLSQEDWWDSPNQDQVDLYLLGHGLAYKDAIADYIKIGGKIAMPPRAVNGIFWSRWNNIGNRDVMDIVDDYKAYNMPLDVYILDMDWHTKNAWGGYTWDLRLFPHPKATSDWIHSQNLLLGVNLHDDDGVGTFEATYSQVAKALNWQNTTTTIPFTLCSNNQQYNLGARNYTYALEDIVLGDLERSGVDFWWTDWQQGGKEGGCEGEKQNPTIWLNKLRATDHIRRKSDKRAFVLARWGGLGNHRYQVGFSGDVNDLTWQSLAFQPYFSFTASNVGYGFWSHDLVGSADDHELHTRWLQFGAFSGTFRTHDRGMAEGSCADTAPFSCGVVDMWNVPSMFVQANREAVHARETLIPYIYNATRQAFDDGISLLRPMYYEFPQNPEAYLADGTGIYSQYMFGEHIMAAPMVAAADAVTSMANTTIWLPPGSWYSKVGGRMYTQGSAGRVVTMAFDLDEIPLFFRAGAMIPQIPVRRGDTVGLAARQYHHLIFTIYPGKQSHQDTLYEDDGKSTAYLKGAWTRTNFSYAINGAKTDLTVSVAATAGVPYGDFPKERRYTFRLVDTFPIAKSEIVVNGDRLRYNRNGGEGTWYFDGLRMETVIETKAYATAAALTMHVKLAPFDFSKLNGYSGTFQRSIKAKYHLDLAQYTPGSQTVSSGRLMELSSIAEELSYLIGVDMNAFLKALATVPSKYLQAVQEIESIKPTSSYASEPVRSNSQHAHRSALLASKSLKYHFENKPRAASSRSRHVASSSATAGQASPDPQAPSLLYLRWAYSMQMLWSVN